MKKKLLFVFNPKSGKGLIKEHLVNIVDIMTKAGYKITIYPTQCQGDAIKKVRKNAKKYDLVVCSGGDGTLDEVVTGMEQSEVNVPIGYIPAGSTYDFANSLGIPKRPDCYSVDRPGTVTLSDPDQSSGTGYVCPLHVHIHR